jgi:hypothetical protein
MLGGSDTWTTYELVPISNAAPNRNKAAAYTKLMR